jgi:hypothetical protein
VIQDYDRSDRLFQNRTAIHKNAPRYINIAIALLKNYKDKKALWGLTAPQKYAGAEQPTPRVDLQDKPLGNQSRVNPRRTVTLEQAYILY